MENENVEKKWYQKTWGIIVLFIIFPPIGLYFLWKSDDYSQKAKSIVTSIAVFLIIASIFQNDSIDYANDKEIFVGKDSNGSKYYLLTDSIAMSGLNEAAKGIVYHICKIKIIDTDGIENEFFCKFYMETKNKPARFEDSHGNSGVIEKNKQTIASNAYIALHKHLDAKRKQELEQEEKAGR